MAYANGKEVLFSPVVNYGFDEGKQAEYDAFWDAYQQNGARTNYQCAFGGSGWNVETFKPKYDIVPTDAVMIFRNNAMTNDLVEILEKLGVKLDFSNCTNMQYAFYSAQFERVGEIKLNPKALGTEQMFNISNITTVDKIVLPDNNTLPLNLSTQWLVNIDFEGTIYRNFTATNARALSVQSAKNAINHLANYAGTENEGVYSFKLNENTWLAFDGTAPDGNTWKNYVQSLGWLI